MNDLVPLFYGRDVSDEGEQQDPAEFIKNLTFAMDGQVYTDEVRNQIASRVIFQTRLRDKALLWYQSLPAEVQSNWELLENSLHDLRWYCGRRFIKYGFSTWSSISGNRVAAM